LDNYSFIQVRSSAADTIIEALNGQSFRGRILSVNYARPRKDEGEENRECPLSETHEDGADVSEQDGFPDDREAGNPEDWDSEENGVGESEPLQQNDDHPDEKDI
jgi:RNA recognition motif-containing protein